MRSWIPTRAKFMITFLALICACVVPACTASAPAADRSVHVKAPPINLRALDSPAPVVTAVFASDNCVPAYPTPVQLFNDQGQLLFGRGPCDYRNPVTGQFATLPRGAEIAFTDGPVEVEVLTPCGEDPPDET